MKASVQAKATTSDSASTNPALATFLQRACSCDGSGGVSGECAGCDSERRFGTEGLQPKLTVSAPHDPYEQEADRLADEVVRAPTGGVAPASLGAPSTEPASVYRRVTPLIQRQSDAEFMMDEEEEAAIQSRSDDTRALQRQEIPGIEEDEEETVEAARSPQSDSSSPSISPRPTFNTELRAERGGGEPMRPQVRAFMESRFGIDLGHVRIHRSRRAAELAQSIHAQAFTVGHHIFFGSEHFDPDTTNGCHLLAHELVHTIQQEAAPASAPIQRQADTFVPRRLPDGELVHATVLPALGKENSGLFTEVKIPGAKDMVRGESQAGIADLYKAVDGPETTIAVIMENGRPAYLESRSKPVKGQRLRSELLKEGKRFPHKNKGAPRGADKGGNCDGMDVDVCRLNAAPRRILLGDLKPASGLKILLGKGQIGDYRAGIESTSNALNAFIDQNPQRAHPANTKWSPKTGVLGDLTIPATFTLAKGKPQVGLRLYDDRKEDEPINGLEGPLVVYKQSDGIWAYEWIPTKYPPALRKSGSKKLTAALSRIDLLIKQLKTPPKKTKARKALPGHPARTARPGRPARRPALLQRRVEFEPTRWRTDFKDWRKTEATAFLGSKGVGLVPAGKGAVPESEEAKVSRVAAALTGVKRRTGLPLPLPPAIHARGQAFKRIQRWARWGLVFGRIRAALGGLFVKIGALYDKAKAKFDALHRKRAEQGPSGGDRITTAIFRSAFRVAVTFFKVIVQRVTQQLKRSLEKAAGVLIGALFGEERLEQLEEAKETFENLANRVETEIKEDVEERIKPLVEPYEETFETIGRIKEWVGNVGKLVSAVKWGLRIVQCLTPPGLGCLKLIVQALAEELVARVTASCWFQLNFMKPLLSKVEVFKTLPGKISGLILGQVKKMAGALPFTEESLNEAFPTPTVNTNVTGRDLGCDPTHITKAQREMNKLLDKYGHGRIRELIKLLEEGGLTDDREMTVEDVHLLRGLLEKINKGEITEVELSQALSNLKQGRGSGVKDIDDLLDRLGVGPAARKTAGEGTGAGGIRVVEFDKAKYTGPRHKVDTKRFSVVVLDPSLSHAVGSSQTVQLALVIDGNHVMTVTGVPAVVVETTDSDLNGRPVRIVRYKLKQYVKFQHGVKGAPPVLVAGPSIGTYVGAVPLESGGAE